MKKWLIERWYAEKAPRFLLPISFCYQSIMAIRRWLYRCKIMKTTEFMVPIVVVGNLTVGGSGKTPFVIWLAEWLKNQGLRPGLVSRGYGGVVRREPQFVSATSNPALVGDEAVMLVQKTQCPMWVSADRVAATQALLTNNHCDVVISDDGLQHLALGRKLEIVLIDGMRGFGNGYCLPAGPLREPLSRLKTYGLKVSTTKSWPDAWLMQLMPGSIYQLIDQKQQLLPSDLSHREVHAVAGIGNPQRFFQQLTQLGITFIAHAFPDHYTYCHRDIDFGEHSIVIMTEKDAVKCIPFADQRHWCLPVHAQLAEGFVSQLHSLLR